MVEPFSAFVDTKKTSVVLGTVKTEVADELLDKLNQTEFTMAKILSKANETVVSVVCIKESFDMVNQILSEYGFNKCPFTFDKVASAEIDRLEKENANYQKEEKRIDKEVCAFSSDIKTLKVYADYYKFLIEKEQASDEFKNTKTTFVLEAYLPKEDQELVLNAVEKVTKAVFVDFSEPTKEDDPPILLKNKNTVKQTEFVTDMYSAPNYRELDTNKIVFFFFMLFMGVIMADVGYGILMLIAGRFLAVKIKIDNGARRLWNVISFSGIFAIIFGVLFNSYFGAALPYSAVLPSPVPKGGDTSGLMTILLMCLGLGVLHMATGYFLKAVNGFRSRDIWGGILDGLTWVTFLIGLVFATFNFLVNYLMPEVYLTMNPSLKNFFDTMTMPGIIMIGASVFIAMIGAGRNEKGFGKFTKGFGSVYGIINILSDILSYARLFGLMLSGMIIASTFNDMGIGLMSNGVVGYILGGVVIFVGHAFNVAMGVLGAYIHNSRLQYIEFFGKFYTGEGEKFKPLGTTFDFIHLRNE
jgi:V/A-type H+-transporting ATPase subunit I